MIDKEKYREIILKGDYDNSSLDNISYFNNVEDEVILIHELSTMNDENLFINQVTVNGQGVTATVRDAISIALNNVVKEEIINDTKITTYNDALIRANAELMSFNKYNNQYNPKQILNVGSELYDVIHITNTGNNSTNINQDVRIYSQEMDVGGDSISYYLLVETGTK